MIFAIILALSPAVVSARSTRFDLEVHNVTCQSFTNHLKRWECNITKVETGRFLFNAKIMYDKKFSKDGILRIQLLVKHSLAEQSVKLIDLSTDVCVFTSQAVVHNNLLRNVFTELIRSSNLPLDCAYKANFMYKVENYSLATDLIPPYAPFSDGRLIMEYFEDSEKVLHMLAYATLVAKRNG